ncbi:MAG: hypothetical protein WCO62_06105 [Betaproteobacteria bacterium]
MELANGRLRLNKLGSDVPVSNITPAEALILHIVHQGNNGGSTFGEDFEKITVVSNDKRSDNDEVRRLSAKYAQCVNKKGDKLVKLIWPGIAPKLPQKFAELDWKNINYDGVEVSAINYITQAPVAANPTK